MGQLAKEFQRRQNFIASTSSINQDMSQLRANLDASLQNVSDGSVRYMSSEELGKTLDREGTKLHKLSQNFINTASSAGKIQGATNRLDQEQRMKSSNLYPKNVKRALSFEDIIT